MKSTHLVECSDIYNQIVEQDIRSMIYKMSVIAQNSDSVIVEDGDSESQFDYNSLKEFFKTQPFKQVAEKTVDALINWVCKLVDVKPEDIKKKNQKGIKALLEMLEMPDNVIPLAVIKYQSTNTTFVFGASPTAAITTATMGMPKLLAKFSPTLDGWLKKTFPNASKLAGAGLIPIKVDTNGSVSLDLSAAAMSQLCMTLLLSDIDFDTLWPINMKSGWIQKFLDMICPSVLDLVVLVVAVPSGGTSLTGSIAARVAKISGKMAAKGAAKAIGKSGLKITTKGVIKIGNKAVSKSVSKAIKKMPKVAQKTVKKAISATQKGVSKAYQKSKASRAVKSTIRTAADALKGNE